MLVVDDIKDVALLLGHFLAPRGYQLAYAYDGDEALVSAKFFRPHLILLNLIMPRMNGFEALPHLRAMPELAGAKIILQTAKSLTPEQVRSRGLDGYLLKPFSDKELLAEVSRVLEQRR